MLVAGLSGCSHQPGHETAQARSAVAPVRVSAAELARLPQVDCDRIAVKGVCQTGRHPLVFAAERRIAAALVWYGAASENEWKVSERFPRPLDDIIARIECPVLGIFGEADHVISLSDVRRFRDCLDRHDKTYAIKVYPGAPHGWLNDTMPGRYRRAPAEAAWALQLAFLARVFAPSGNSAATRFDALIVLGTPADSDGNPTPAMLARVSEGVREYERGVAPRMILTGGLDGRPFVEANVMARVAQAQGVPASAIVLEPDANDTIHNACYAARIMKAHGWRSAEVVANSIQLPRAAIIFSRLSIDWHTHAAPPIEPQSTTNIVAASAMEVLKTVRYLFYGNWAESCPS